ncbi:MAG: OmpW/AlkL family protein [Pseudomonadales bacterium]
MLPVLFPAICTTIGLTLAAIATAHEAGDFIVRSGYANVEPDDSSGALELNGDRAPLAGAEVGVKSDAQLGLTVAYMFTEHLGMELLASTPFEHEITAKGAGVDKVGTAKHLPPTLNLQYYPMSADSAFQPYVGIGVNYTVFFSEDVSNEFEAALGNSDMSLDDSFGLSLQIGADYSFNDRWMVNAAVWRLDLATSADIDIDTANGPASLQVDVDIDPWVYMLGVGYKF